ncbi:hypothetical protein BJ741DRAFT_599680 [Chytriomyces cf. hyalinus JEL632]|nr:hypothetical protein BJ741DRAFT_599680 [Chytriomyces cf. hyalinus JEL632]
MIAPIARSLVARPRFTRAGSSAPVGPWGPMQFAGDNWQASKGAIPFGVRNRAVFLTVFSVLTAGLFSIPFVNLEMNVYETRKEAAKKQEELKEQMRGETSMKI